jgi:toxin FitB
MDRLALLGSQRRAGLDGWLEGIPRLGSTDDVSRAWGTLSAAVRRGRPRPAKDTWNAACCLVEGLPLATLNIKDYVDFVDHHALALITAD